MSFEEQDEVVEGQDEVVEQKTEVEEQKESAHEVEKPKAASSPKLSQKSTKAQNSAKFDFSSLPEDVQELYKKYDNDPVKFAKAYEASNALLGKRYESFNDQDWKLFIEKNEQIRDIPQTSDGYEFNFNSTEEDHEDLLSDEWKDSIKQLAYYSGLNRNQANDVFNFLNFAFNLERSNVSKNVYDYVSKNREILKKDWGEDKFDIQLARANKAIDIWARVINKPAEEILEEVQKVGAQHSAIFLELLAAIGASDAQAASTQSYASSTMTPLTAEVRLKELRNDHQRMSILANPTHPQYAQVRQEIATLSSIKNKEYARQYS
ncbi:MAG: hypothetical protein LBJ80_00075 [Rickettsiales bacterium]|jgi:hypothetical protein|nr:hypothetical protein [Rickettsiales bacterium]